eukprot:jgi/Mesen1/1421/ME001303S00467
MALLQNVARVPLEFANCSEAALVKSSIPASSYKCINSKVDQRSKSLRQGAPSFGTSNRQFSSNSLKYRLYGGRITPKAEITGAEASAPASPPHSLSTLPPTPAQPSPTSVGTATVSNPYPGPSGPFTGRDPTVKKPSWLRQRAPQGERYEELKDSLRTLKLNTVCEEAQCPNIGELLLLPLGVKPKLERVSWAPSLFSLLGRGTADEDKKPPARRLGSRSATRGDVGYVVLTSVDRDDLVDGGSGQFARTALAHVHTYEQTLSVLRHAKQAKEGMVTKSSIMLGLGEKEHEVRQTMDDLRAAGVDILTLGQTSVVSWIGLDLIVISSPTPLHLTVKEYVTPEKFDSWREYGESIGFRYVASGPLVRSSYRAGEFFVETMLREERAKLQAARLAGSNS